MAAQTPPAEAQKLWVAVDSSLPIERSMFACAALGWEMAKRVDAERLHCIDHTDADGACYPSIMWHGLVNMSGKQAGLNKCLKGACDLGLEVLVIESGGSTPYSTKSELAKGKVVDALAVFGPDDTDGMKPVLNKLSMFTPKVEMADLIKMMPGAEDKIKDASGSGLILFAPNTSPQRAVNTAGHLSLGLSNLMHNRQKQPSQMWNPSVLILPDMETSNSILQQQYEKAKKANLPCVAYLTTMEEGGTEIELANTLKTKSSDVVFTAVVIGGSGKSSRQMCPLSKGTGKLLGEDCPLCDGKGYLED